MEWYELAWAEALAQEHERRSELLATLDRELGTFAAECAAALTALDALVDLDAVAGLLDTPDTGSRNAALARDIAHRLPGLARTDTLRDEQLSGFYTHLGEDDDLSTAMVQQTGQLLRADPQRADGTLLRAIIDAAGARSVIQQVVGPASVTALNALKPLAHWAPALARLGEGDGSRGKLVAAARADLTAVLESTAAATGQTVAADSIALADSLQDTVEHVEKAARAITDGQLEQAIADAHRGLDTDLDDLSDVVVNAGRAPHAWRVARHTELTALVEEVREKLEKVEKIRRALELILPQLQVTARALATIEKLRNSEGKLDAPSAAGVKAARMLLLLVAAAAFEASLPESRHKVAAPRPFPKRLLVGVAAVVIVAIGIAVVVTLIGGSKKAPDATLSLIPAGTIPPPPTLSPVKATFGATQDETEYSIAVQATPEEKLTYNWHLMPPQDNPGCNTFGTVYGSPDRAIWHHGATDGCSHLDAQHLGTVTVTVKTPFWECTESYFGTQAGTGVPPQPCSRV